MVNDPVLKEQIQAAYYRDDVGEINYFAVPATIAAYRFGEQYVEELNEYLLINKQYVKNYLNDHLPRIKLVSGQATYLLWLDISSYGLASDIFAQELREKTGLFISDGLHYGKNGGSFIRMNIATNLDNIKDAMERLSNYLKGK